MSIARESCKSCPAVADRQTVREENIRLKDALLSAIGEICRMCGRSRDEELGACDRCKWHPIKDGNPP